MMLFCCSDFLKDGEKWELNSDIFNILKINCFNLRITNESDVPDENIIYLNLDKRGFRNIKTADQLDTLIEQMSDAEGIKYLFIDEIQNVKEFEEVINGYRLLSGI